GLQKTQKLIDSDHVDFISGYIWSNVLLASLKPIVDSKTFLVIANAGPSQVAGELCSPTVFSTSWNNDQTPQAMGLYMNQKGVKTAFLIGPNYAAGATRFLGRVGKGQSCKARRDLRVLSGQGRRAIPGPVRASRAEGHHPALYSLHHRRVVVAAAEGSRARRARRAGVGQ